MIWFPGNLLLVDLDLDVVASVRCNLGLRKLVVRQPRFRVQKTGGAVADGMALAPLSGVALFIAPCTGARPEPRPGRGKPGPPLPMPTLRPPARLIRRPSWVARLACGAAAGLAGFARARTVCSPTGGRACGKRHAGTGAFALWKP